MNHFPCPLRVEPIWGGNWRQRRLLSDFCYCMAHAPAKLIIVPEGFVTDYASIPQIFWSWLPSWGPYGPAAVIHDYLYRRRDTITVPNPDAPAQKIKNSREVADKIFLIAMKQLGVGWIKRRIMYAAVRLCGSKAWAT